MNFRLNSFFWTFAIVSSLWHIGALMGQTQGSQLGAVAQCLIITIVLWALIVPTDLIIGEYRRASIGYVDRNGWPSWEDMSREHRWAAWYETDGFFAHDPDRHVRTKVIICGNCHQWRRVWTGLSMEDVRWGCPKIPWTYRNGHASGVPPWSVNERPPWIKKVVRGGHDD